MRTLLIGVALLALAAPAARAQQAAEPAAPAAAGQAEAGTFTVHFAFNKAALDAEARQVIAEAADEYRRAGAATIAVTGHTDTAGTVEYNQKLSERRADTVRHELVRLGVPEGAIQVAGVGESDLAVPTADGVPEPRNRRVVIAIPQPPPPAPVAAAPPPPPPPAPAPAHEKMRAGRFGVSVGPIFGHNFKEQDKGETHADYGGVELVFDTLPGFLGGLSLKQDVLYAFSTGDNGAAGRTVLSLDFAPDLGFVRPRLSLNAGGIYGNGVQTGFVAGPELALDLNLTQSFTLRPKIAYDYQFRNADLDKGIVWGGLDLGIRF